MPKPQLVLNVALGALLLGMIFLGLNLYFGAHGHPSLAKTCFMLAIASDGIFAVSAVFWSYCAAWVREVPRPGAPMPGGAMPGVQMQGGPMKGVIPGAKMPAGMQIQGVPMPGAPQPPRPPQT